MNKKMLCFLLCCSSLIAFAGGYNPEKREYDTIELYKKIWRENQQKFTIQSESEFKDVLGMSKMCFFLYTPGARVKMLYPHEECAPFLAFLQEVRATGLLNKAQADDVDWNIKMDEFAVKNRIFDAKS